MVAMQSLEKRGSTLVEDVVEDGRLRILERCGDLLEEESFAVTRVSGSFAEDEVRPPDLIAKKGSETIRIIVLEEDEVDAQETEDRVRAAKQRGETRVYVPWPLRWRAISNLQRWGIPGVAVVGV